MADIEAARFEIEAALAAHQRVVSLLVNRFGHEHEVFALLTKALGHLNGALQRTVVEPPPAEELSPVIAEDVPSEVAAPAEVETTPPPAPARRRGRRRF